MYKAKTLYNKYFLTFLFFIGILHWFLFCNLVYPFNCSEIFSTGIVSFVASSFEKKAFSLQDWTKINQMFGVIKDALQGGVIPYHVPEIDNIIRSVQGRFFAAPSYTIAPHVLLIYFLDSSTFYLVNLLLMYSVGFYGCILIKKHYSLGLVPFTFLFILFNFNGYFVEKYVAYGDAQMGYFLIPFLILYILKVSETAIRNLRAQIRYGLLIGIVLSGMLWLGSLHIFLNCMTFVLIWGLVNYKLWKVSLTFFATAIITSTIRIFPALVTVDIGGRGELWPGYGYSHNIVAAFAKLPTLTSPWYMHSWEYSIYTGSIGLCALMYFGCFGSFMKGKRVQLNGWYSIGIPCVYVLVLSMWGFRKYLAPDFIPLINKEYIPSRYIFIPVLMFSVIASINMNEFIKKYNNSNRVKFALSILCFLIAVSVFNHSRIWRMHKSQDDFEQAIALNEAERNSYQSGLDRHAYIDNNPDDIVYIASFWIGLFVSLLSLIVVVWWLWRDWKRRKTELNRILI
tara:strand:- start:1772 stop:3304 length:1533 start_codon:yes stop_codon:yes gene_type:complete